MGTSASSSGPGGGVPLVPRWVPDVDESGRAAEQERRSADAAVRVATALAPPARFGSARRNLGEFARASDQAALRRGLASYVRRGLGGSANGARRMGGAAVRSGALSRVLHALGSRTLDPAALGLDANALAGRSAREIIDRVARLVSPSDGTLDAESSQRAVNAALSDLLSEDEGIDLASLTEQQIEWVIERHLVHEILIRIELDVGKSVLDKAPSPSAAISRLDEIRGYIQETVAASFREQRRAGRVIDNTQATRLAANVIQDTLSVFEEYVE